jgi:hypothetical protein
MANEYSVAIHNYISGKIAAAEKNRKDAEQENDLASIRYYMGQLKELNNIRQYMVDKIDLKTQKYY